MSGQRRSSSPLSSASPSPLQAPVLGEDQTLASLHLGPAAVSQEDGDIIGGSSPTTLTEPLTDSELTEDDDDDEAEVELEEDVDVEDSRKDDALENHPSVTGNGHIGQIKRERSSEKSQLSPSPSLTPPPPSDPPRCDALPSSPRVADDDDDNDKGEQAMANDDESDDEPTPGDRRSPAAVDQMADSDTAAEAKDTEEGDDEDEGDGDVTMRAEGDAEAEEENDAEEAVLAETEAAADDEVEDAVDDDEEEDNETADANNDSSVPVPSRSGHSSHAPPPSAAAMRGFLALEVKFAALRDRLYVERLEEAAREEEMILDGTHPALLHLNKTLESRRERLHEIAARRHEETSADLGRWRDVEKSITWSTWTDQRDRMHWEEFEHTWSKRRRLAREKNELETPKVARPVPRTSKSAKQFNWSAGAMPLRLSSEESLQDLQMMDLSRQQQIHQQHLLQQQQQHQQQQQQQQQNSRHASPAMYGSYNGPPSYAYQAAQSHPASYLQHETQEANRQSQLSGPARQHARPVASSAMGYSDGGNASAQRPAQGNAGGSSQQHMQQAQHNRKSTLGAEVFGVPRRDQPMAPSHNGEAKHTNGHSRHSSNALGTLVAPASESKPSTQHSGTAAGHHQDRPNASARFPGLADYLSGSATPPQNTFQHHLLSSNTSSGISKTNLGASQSGAGTPSPAALSSSLARPVFSQVAQPQTANAQRS